MPERRRLTSSRFSCRPSQPSRETLQAISSSNQSPRSSPSNRTNAPSKRVKSLLVFLISCHKGLEVELFTVFELTPEENETLWSMLERRRLLYDYVLGKLRFDWSPHTSSFIVRMPTSTHDIFTELIVREIWSQLENVARGDKEVAAIVDLVRSEATSDVYLYGHGSINNRYPKHPPDASLAHADSQYPFMVIETSYPQRHKDLAKLADDYICGSNGNISMVLGLDIEYGVGSKRASVSIWRPRLAPDPENKEGMLLEMVGVPEADPFRADDGTTVQGHGLSLQLCDFAPRTRFANMPQDTQSVTVVQITCKQLSSFLHDAETRDKIKRAQQGAQIGLPLNCRKRRREATPPEALSPGKEAKFAKREAEEAAKSEAEDPVWR